MLERVAQAHCCGALPGHHECAGHFPEWIKGSQAELKERPKPEPCHHPANHQGCARRALSLALFTRLSAFSLFTLARM